MVKNNFACESRLQQNFTFALLLLLLSFSSQYIVLFSVSESFTGLWNSLKNWYLKKWKSEIPSEIPCSSLGLPYDISYMSHMIQFRIGFARLWDLLSWWTAAACRVAHYFRHFEKFCPGLKVYWSKMANKNKTEFLESLWRCIDK